MTNRTNAALVAVMALVLLSTASVILVADDSSAELPIYHVEPGVDGLQVKAGSTATFDVLITNSNAFLDHDISDDIVLSMVASVRDGAGNATSDITASVAIRDRTGSSVVLEGPGSADFIVALKAGVSVDSGDYTVVCTISAVRLSGESLGDPLTVSHAVHLLSDTSSSAYYNKFLGLFPNEMDGMFGEVWFTALATFLIILLIGVVASFIISPVISILMTTKSSSDRKILRRSMFIALCFASAVFGLSRALCVIGLSNGEAAFMDTLCNLIYILIIVYVVWKIYGAILDRVSERIEARDSRDALDNFLSFKPLFLYLGKIVLALATVFSVMGMFGFDMAAIITSAGLITLGITFGAQHILSQFFAGLLLLTTRPFKKGDLIQIGSDVVYRVRKVNVMSTELENWDNSDVTIVPNNTLTSSNVKNITRDTLRTKAYIYVGVGYGVDLDQARALMVEAAQENAHVIQDGTAAGPSTRIMDFEDSNILLRLCVWVDDYNVALGVAGEIRDAMYKRFNAAGVSIDYPQVVLHKADEKDD
ncbi:MAG: mechanosensitive ion channel family protein [archaeon]|nr:mechanosensitive ion channel family protein [archaeon]